jgi:DNA-directed RNA polymerase subunit RPC12/RpoP
MPDRFIVLKCPRCRADLEVADDMTCVPCSDCGTKVIVERKHGTIISNMEREAAAKQVSAQLAAAGLNGEISELTHESARIRRPKILAEAIGGTCGMIFGFFGISALLVNDLGAGFILLLCAGGSLWFVLFVIRDTNTRIDKLRRKTKEIKSQIEESERIANQAVRASELGLDRVALNLFLNYITYYPSWTQHSRGYVPAIIGKPVKVGLEGVKLTMGDSEYLFTLEREQLNDGSTRGTLDVCVNNILVLSVGGTILQDQWGARTSSHYSNVFVDGPWVQELFALSTEAKKCQDAQAKLRRGVPQV